MRELDVVLTRFLNDHYADAEIEQQRAFCALLEREDPEIFAFLVGREQPPDVLTRRLIERLLDPDAC